MRRQKSCRSSSCQSGYKTNNKRAGDPRQEIGMSIGHGNKKAIDPIAAKAYIKRRDEKVGDPGQETEGGTRQGSKKDLVAKVDIRQGSKGDSIAKAGIERGNKGDSVAGADTKQGDKGDPADQTAELGKEV